jgi:hypothetical protein
MSVGKYKGMFASEKTGHLLKKELLHLVPG